MLENTHTILDFVLYFILLSIICAFNSRPHAHMQQYYKRNKIVRCLFALRLNPLMQIKELRCLLFKAIHLFLRIQYEFPSNHSIYQVCFGNWGTFSSWKRKIKKMEHIDRVHKVIQEFVQFTLKHSAPQNIIILYVFVKTLSVCVSIEKLKPLSINSIKKSKH